MSCSVYFSSCLRGRRFNLLSFPLIWHHPSIGIIRSIIRWFPSPRFAVKFIDPLQLASARARPLLPSIGSSGPQFRRSGSNDCADAADFSFSFTDFVFSFFSPPPFFLAVLLVWWRLICIWFASDLHTAPSTQGKLQSGSTVCENLRDFGLLVNLWPPPAPLSLAPPHFTCSSHNWNSLN